MKGKELEKVADKHLRSIEKYCKRIPGTFTIVDIHDLRVDYKRLRAFIRLCKEETHTRSLDMPEPLRELYRAAGSVRDHQLFLAKISLFAKVEYALPGFTQCLQQQLFRKKEELVKKIEKADWGKIRKSIESALPAVLHDAAIRQFVNRKVASIHILMLAAEKEEDLHEVRKNLKDLIHASRVFDQDLLIPFPFPAWKSEKPICDMAEKLGDFNDECITLSFLESTCQENITAEERDSVNAWRTIQCQQVEAGKKKLLQEVLQLDLTVQNAPVK
jgi:CHAD domain-containing protein